MSSSWVAGSTSSCINKFQINTPNHDWVATSKCSDETRTLARAPDWRRPTDSVWCKHFALLDFCFSFLQCPLKPLSYQRCEILAPPDSYVSARALYRLKNASAYLHFTIPSLYDTMEYVIKARLDDCIVYTTIEANLLQYLDKFFTICKNHSLHLSATRCVFYTMMIKPRGKIIDGTVKKPEPRNIELLQNIEAPVTASELCQSVRCCRWVRDCIQRYHIIVRPLVEIHKNTAYANAGKRKKNAMKTTAPNALSWSTEHVSALVS